ncbi:hypothetical protein J6253_01785 [bacterium]|nr:hypothetical protein [bacterium]MBP5591967.1 hypothetical protein [bacterium]
MILKRSFLIFLFFPIFFASCSKAEKPQDPVTQFMQARIDGNTHQAYILLDKTTQATFSEKDFEEYCFVFKPSEFEILLEENGYTPVSYTFYDKKYKKGSNELYTFYMTKNVEHVKLSGGKIVFPHIAFLSIRKAIEEKNIEKAKFFSDIMLGIDQSNPDVLETAENMGFIQKRD